MVCGPAAPILTTKPCRGWPAVFRKPRFFVQDQITTENGPREITSRSSENPLRHVTVKLLSNTCLVNYLQPKNTPWYRGGPIARHQAIFHHLQIQGQKHGNPLVRVGRAALGFPERGGTLRIKLDRQGRRTARPAPGPYLSSSSLECAFRGTHHDDPPAARRQQCTSA